MTWSSIWKKDTYGQLFFKKITASPPRPPRASVTRQATGPRAALSAFAPGGVTESCAQDTPAQIPTPRDLMPISTPPAGAPSGPLPLVRLTSWSLALPLRRRWYPASLSSSLCPAALFESARHVPLPSLPPRSSREAPAWARASCPSAPLSLLFPVLLSALRLGWALRSSVLTDLVAGRFSRCGGDEPFCSSWLSSAFLHSFCLSPASHWLVT